MPSHLSDRFQRLREAVAPATEYVAAIGLLLGLVTAYALALQLLLTPASS